MRTKGRRVFPESTAEHRVLAEFGEGPLYVPRGVSPFLVARRLTRAARCQERDVLFVRDLLARPRPPKSDDEPPVAPAAAVVVPLTSEVEHEPPPIGP